MSNSIPGNEWVTDTMGLILRLEGRKLGSAAKLAFEAVENGSATIYVPAMTLAEILRLSEKKRIRTTLQDTADYFKRHPSCREYPLNLAVIEAAAQLLDISELHDRLIAATARLLQRPLITNDPVIQACAGVTTVW
jgi:predicted nucleic acid-binding protein